MKARLPRPQLFQMENTRSARCARSTRGGQGREPLQAPGSAGRAPRAPPDTTRPAAVCRSSGGSARRRWPRGTARSPALPARRGDRGHTAAPGPARAPLGAGGTRGHPGLRPFPTAVGSSRLLRAPAQHRSASPGTLRERGGNGTPWRPRLHRRARPALEQPQVTNRVYYPLRVHHPPQRPGPPAAPARHPPPATPAPRFRRLGRAHRKGRDVAHRLTQHVTRRRLRSAGERAPARAAAMGAAAAEADRTLFVGNLDPKVTEELIFELFHQAGPVVKVKIPRDRDGRPKQFAFVNFKHEESVPYGLSLLNGIKLYGRPIKIQFRSGSSHASQDGNPSCSPHGAASASPAHPASSCGRYDRSPDGIAAAGFPSAQRPLPPDALQRQLVLKNVPWQHAPPFGKYEPPGFSFLPPPHAFPPAPRRPELPAPRKGRLGAHPYLPESRRFGERGKREELGAEERDEHRYRAGRDEPAYEERQRDGWSHDYRRDGYRDTRWHPARH